MGYYLESGRSKKVNDLINKHSAVLIEDIEEARELVNDLEYGVVVVLNNGIFDAAGYAYSENELDAFMNPRDNRERTMLKMKRDTIKKLIPTHSAPNL